MSFKKATLEQSENRTLGSREEASWWGWMGPKQRETRATGPRGVISHFEAAWLSKNIPGT